MFSNHVEAVFLGEADIMDHRLFADGSQTAFRGISLIEDPFQEIGFPIEGEDGVAMPKRFPKRAEGAIGMNPVFFGGNFDAIEVWFFGAP